MVVVLFLTLKASKLCAYPFTGERKNKQKGWDGMKHILVVLLVITGLMGCSVERDNASSGEWFSEEVMGSAK